MGRLRIPWGRLLVWLTLLALMLAVAVWTVVCVRGPAADSPPQPAITTEDLLATAAAFSEAQATARPTSTPAPDVVERPSAGSCAPPDREPPGDSPHFLHWTPDGSRLIFDLSDTIWAVDSQGTYVAVVVDADPEADSRSVYEFYADLSPDGSRIVYSTCEYPLGISTSESSGTRHFYEIATADLDGGGQQRLTESPAFDSYPVWSPDGESIAFIRSGGRDDDTWVYLFEYGSVPRRWWLGGQDVEAGLYPPAWSPNGESLALVGYESTSDGHRPCLYAGGARDPGVIQFRTTRSEVFRVTEATGPPSWSPDGQYLAFTRSGEEDAGVYVIRPGGTDLRRIVDGSSEGPLWPPDVTELPENVNTFRGSPAWTSDGKRLLFITREIDAGLIDESTGFVPSRVFTVGLDGGDVVELDLPLPEFVRVTAAAWSPDGSRVAVSGDIRQFPESEHSVRRVILTADPDGGNMRILAAGDTVLNLVSGHYDESVGGLFEWNRPDPGSPVDTSPCSEGFVVPIPGENPGLVQDCETLLTIRDTLAGRVDLNWNAQTPIGEWEGVTTGGEPFRVQSLRLSEQGLTGVLPPELGLLSGLVELDSSGNWLTGPIPPELGKLAELEVLDLSSNFLSGGIPPEMGMLERLSRLALSGNRLSGGIPGEIYGLVSLRSLELWGDRLTTCFPAEYPEIQEEQANMHQCEPKVEAKGWPFGWGVLR